MVLSKVFRALSPRVAAVVRSPRSPRAQCVDLVRTGTQHVKRYAHDDPYAAAQIAGMLVMDLLFAGGGTVYRGFDLYHDTVHVRTEACPDGTLLDVARMFYGAAGETNFLILAAMLGRVLQHLAANGAVHNDIKPENVLCWTRGGVLVGIDLIDFDMATAHDEDVSQCGTVAFVPPEKLISMPGIAQRVDVWSAVMTLFLVRYHVLPHGLDVNAAPREFAFELAAPACMGHLDRIAPEAELYDAAFQVPALRAEADELCGLRWMQHARATAIAELAGVDDARAQQWVQALHSTSKLGRETFSHYRSVAGRVIATVWENQRH